MGTHQFPSDGPEDADQDRALRALVRASGEDFDPPIRSREYGYGLVASEGTPLGQSFTRNLRAIEQVIDWTVTQEATIKLAVIEYLEDPDDSSFEHVLSVIGISAPVGRGKRADSLATLIQRSLPARLEDLYVLARRNHASNRPEAAVRQTIRNLKRRGLIVEDEAGTLCLQAEMNLNGVSFSAAQTS